MSAKEVDILIEKVKSGDSASFEQIVDTYKNMVFSICLKITENPELAEEVAQDTFLKAYQKLNTFKKRSKFSTWLYQIAYTTAINAIRKKKIIQKDIDIATHIESEENSIDHLSEKDRNEYLHKALQHLEVKERSILCLYYLDEMNIKEVSEITGLSQSNIKVKVHRSRKKLYQILSALLKDELNSIRQ